VEELGAHACAGAGVESATSDDRERRTLLDAFVAALAAPLGCVHPDGL
jgi:hypothetical protein